MCGHVGMMGKKLGALEEDMIQDGLQVCTLRGMDSVGWAVVPVDGANDKPYVQKRLGCPPVFLKFPDKGAKVCIGHVRSATIGNRNDRELAHPFIFDNILGAHNGTLREDWRGALQQGTNEVFGSDSQAVFYNFAYWGVEETIKNITGAWCFIWWDDDEQCLNMLRNDERPLWTATGKSGNLYWASEHWMIGAMLRQGERDRDRLVKTPTADGKEDRFFHKLPANMWRRYHFNDQGVIIQRDDLPLEGKPPAPAAVEERWAGPWSYMVCENGSWVEVDPNTPGAIKVSDPEGLLEAEAKRNFIKAEDVVWEDDHAPKAKKGQLWRVVNGVSYVCKPGQNEITFRQFLEGFDGCCEECGQFIDTPEQIGYLPDNYAWCVCAECAKEWNELDWDSLITEDIGEMTPDQVDDCIKRGAAAAGRMKRGKPANDGPTELGKPGVPEDDPVKALIGKAVERFNVVSLPLPRPKYETLPPLEHGWKYILRNNDGSVNHTSKCKTKAQMDIFARKNKTCSVEVVRTDELDRVCSYVPAPEPTMGPLCIVDDLNDRLPPSLAATPKEKPKLLQLPPATSEWPRRKALAINDGPTF